MSYANGDEPRAKSTPLTDVAPVSEHAREKAIVALVTSFVPFGAFYL